MINVSLKSFMMKECWVHVTFLIIILFSISLPLHTSAKEQAANIWYFGDDAGLDFNAGITPAVLTDDVSLHSGGSAVISDQAGKLLFYTDGTQVWNAQHGAMPNGQDLMGGSFADQPAIIVPNPGQPELYYIFTVSARLGLYYSTVNLALLDGSGDVTEKNIRLWSESAGKITAVSHHNATDIWVIVPSAQDNTFHAYLVTSSGVSKTPVVSQAGIGHSRCEFDLSGSVKASPDGRKLALSVFDPGFFELFDFDTATGQVTNSRFLGDYEGAFGIDFSPDSSKLYATVVSWTQKKIYQFDLESIVIPRSVKVIGETSQETRFRALQVAPDGRIYVARENTRYVGVINYPNRLGLASDYVDEGLYLEGCVCRNDLPNFVQSLFTPPVITLSIHDAMASEADGVAIFTVSVSEASRSDILVDYVTHESTATAESDYLPTFGTVAIPEGALEAKIRIPLIDDDVFDEGPETFSVELSNPVRAVLAANQGTGTIHDNDLVGMTIEDAVAEEGDGRLAFTVRLSQASRSDVSVNYSTYADTATAGNEYAAISGTLTIPAGAVSGTVAVDIIDDQLDEEDKMFVVRLSNPVNTVIDAPQAIGTIRDDDAPPTMSIQDVSMAESDDTMTFTVRLSAVSMLDVTVDYATRDHTAIAHSDYTPTSGTLFIPAGTPFGVIMVDMLDDALNEQDETFLVALSDAVNATMEDGQGTGTMTDNDPLPVIAIDHVTSEEDADVLRFSISLSAVSGRDVSVNYATQDDTALAGKDYVSADGDYVAASGTVTIPAGKVSVALPVTIIDDPDEEQDETLIVRLSQPLNAAPGNERGVGTIRDDDPPPTIAVNDVTADEDAGTMTFVVSLSHASYRDISVNYATTDESATIAGNDYLLLPETLLTIPAGETSAFITVTIHEDTLIEGAETLRLVLERPMNATIADAEGIGTIIDNDALPAVSIDNVTANESAHTLTFTVRLSEKSQLPVIFSYATLDGTATGDSDYVPVSGTMAIVPDSLSGTVVVPIIDDAVAEGEEVFRIELHNLHNATLADNQGVGTIADDDL